jgi:Na+/melibiose symporter-like transporter
MLLLWRASLMFILSFLTAVLFSVFFQWFPLDNWEAWFGFFIAMTVSSAISIFIMFVKIKMEDKKYSMLLSNYKAKHNKKGSEKQ